MQPEHPSKCPWHWDWHQCNCGLFDTVFWNDIREDGVPTLKFASSEEAITEQIKRSEKQYFDQWDALRDFIREHQAWIG